MKRWKIELFVRGKGVDLVALTAKDTFWHELGYKDILIDLEREDYWAFRVLATDSKERDRIGEEIVKETKLFVNPNKHTFRIGKKETIETKPGIFRVGVLISYIEDIEGMMALNTLQNTYGYEGRIVGVKYGVLWSMEIKAKDREKAKELAKEMTVTSSVKKGLLLNPYSQRFSIKWCKGLFKIEGRLLSINIGARKGEKKRPINGSWEVIKDYGLRGDVHGGLGDRQVSLLSIESIEGMKKMGLRIGPGDFAENLTITGVDFRIVSVGMKVRIGKDVVLRISQIGKECEGGCSIYQKIGKCIMPREGVFAKVVRGGMIQVGDKVKIEIP